MSKNESEQSQSEASKQKSPKAKDFAEEFGATIRRLRTAQGRSLRGFAARVDFSPAYLSKIERGEFSPPGEQKIIDLAIELEQDPDELLSVAGRIASDLPVIIRKSPREYARLLRATKHLSREQLKTLTAECKKLKVVKEPTQGTLMDYLEGDEHEK